MSNLPPMTKNLLMVNLLAYIATLVLQMRGIDLNNLLGLHFFLASDFHIYQFITYMFLHGSFMHIFFNMFALWMFGGVIERVWGPNKFLFYYICCGLGAGFIQEIVQYISFYTMVSSQAQAIGVSVYELGLRNAQVLNSWTTIGASGGVYGILLAFGMIFPNERLFIIPIPFPIKAKWLITGYVVWETYLAYASPGDGVAHMAHLGGMFFGFLLIRYWRKHPGTSTKFGRSKGEEFFNNLKRRYDERKQAPHMKMESTGKPESDEEYNARKRQNQEEIDAILDKIRKSGYDSLTREEKQRLFDQSRRS